MTDSHNKSFFGQSTGVILQSPSKTESSIYFQCIKRKSNGKWEKPSKGEGKNIKCSLEEIVMILQVLNRKEDSWSTYHSFKNVNTQISFNWDPNDNKKLWIHIGDYSKILNFSQIEILRILLTHILEEKIEYATSLNGPDSNKEKYEYKNKKPPKNNHKSNGNPPAYSSIPMEEIRVEESIETADSQAARFINKDEIENVDEGSTRYQKIIATVKRETKKALLLLFKTGQEVWIPKSSIKSNYLPNNEISQTFVIEKWLIAKNDIII